MIHSMQIDNKISFFSPTKPHKSVVEVDFSDDTLTLYINGHDKNSFSFQICEIKILLHFLNSKCSSDIYETTYNNESINSYLEIIKRVLINISLSHTLDEVVELINDSCIETALTILQQRDYAVEFV